MLVDKMYNYISGFGIGTKSGIELPQETSGKMPSAEWKKKRYGEEWQLGENLSVAVGQGFVETNPIPVKTALGFMKKINPELRLPLCEMASENQKKLSEVLKKMRMIS